jgi:hypothetical protein
MLKALKQSVHVAIHIGVSLPADEVVGAFELSDQRIAVGFTRPTSGIPPGGIDFDSATPFFVPGFDANLKYGRTA